MKIITETSKLSTHITNTVKMYDGVGRKVHIGVVSALWHVCKHGDPSHLNRLFAALRSNDQTAVKMYIRRVSAIVGLDGENPDGMDSETVIAAVQAGQVLDFAKGEFVTVQGPNTSQAKTLAKFCESRFIAPDGENDRYVLDRNNFAEVKTLGDSEVLKQLISLTKKIDSETETTKVDVSPKIRSFLEEVRGKAETMNNQIELAA